MIQWTIAIDDDDGDVNDEESDNGDTVDESDDDGDCDYNNDVSIPVVWKYPNSLQVWYVHGRALLDALYRKDI